MADLDSISTLTPEQKTLYQQVKALRPKFETGLSQKDEFIILMLLACNDGKFPLEKINELYSPKEIEKARDACSQDFF